ncbi:unnamed protein product [Angiostrongylus costaricensis]|uniref:Uncharacterized protein n=1 Tax=Angiostrongylus costaricensis TaxID=334426 RepID=A0A0R3PAN1_ANGCS|nr:unnamed protein product [Angiostrongylus costaricensis]
MHTRADELTSRESDIQTNKKEEIEDGDPGRRLSLGIRDQQLAKLANTAKNEKERKEGVVESGKRERGRRRTRVDELMSHDSDIRAHGKEGKEDGAPSRRRSLRIRDQQVTKLASMRKMKKKKKQVSLKEKRGSEREDGARPTS